MAPPKSHRSARSKRPKKTWAHLIDISLYKSHIPIFLTNESFTTFCKDVGLFFSGIDGQWEAFAYRGEATDGCHHLALVIPTDSTPDTWAHEAVHITDFVMEYAGIPSSFENTEVRAYLTGFIFREISKTLNKHLSLSEPEKECA